MMRLITSTMRLVTRAAADGSQPSHTPREPGAAVDYLKGNVELLG